MVDHVTCPGGKVLWYERCRYVFCLR